MEKKFTLLGEFLRERRIESGLTQREVAKALDYSPQFIANWESGVSSPPAHVIPKLVRVFKIPEDEILAILFEQSKAYWEGVVRPMRTKKKKRA